MIESVLTPNKEFTHLADEAQIERTVRALEANGIHVVVAEDEAEAKAKLWELIPEGAEVFTNTSRTLDAMGVPAEVDRRYDSVRVKLSTMDRATQNRDMVKLGATPEYMVGSVHAVTEDGTVLVASNTGSQLSGYSAGAEHVIWVVGTQKIVPDLDTAMQRIREYTLPLEDQRAQEAYGMHSFISKLLIINREIMPGRTSMILVKKNLGF